MAFNLFIFLYEQNKIISSSCTYLNGRAVEALNIALFFLLNMLIITTKCFRRWGNVDQTYIHDLRQNTYIQHCRHLITIKLLHCINDFMEFHIDWIMNQIFNFLLLFFQFYYIFHAFLLFMFLLLLLRLFFLCFLLFIFIIFNFIFIFLPPVYHSQPIQCILLLCFLWPTCCVISTTNGSFTFPWLHALCTMNVYVCMCFMSMWWKWESGGFWNKRRLT